MIQKKKVVLLINLCYPGMTFHLIRVFFVLVHACLGVDMVYVSCLSADSVQKRHIYIPLCNIPPYKQLLHLRFTVASLEAGWYLKARLKRTCIPYLKSLFQLYPLAKPINMKQSFPS
jgi:hypothetical protein